MLTEKPLTSDVFRAPKYAGPVFMIIRGVKHKPKRPKQDAAQDFFKQMQNVSHELKLIKETNTGLVNLSIEELEIIELKLEAYLSGNQKEVEFEKQDELVVQFDGPELGDAIDRFLGEQLGIMNLYQHQTIRVEVDSSCQEMSQMSYASKECSQQLEEEPDELLMLKPQRESATETRGDRDAEDSNTSLAQIVQETLEGRKRGRPIETTLLQPKEGKEEGGWNRSSARMTADFISISQNFVPGQQVSYSDLMQKLRDFPHRRVHHLLSTMKVLGVIENFAQRKLYIWRGFINIEPTLENYCENISGLTDESIERQICKQFLAMVLSQGQVSINQAACEILPGQGCNVVKAYISEFVKIMVPMGLVERDHRNVRWLGCQRINRLTGKQEILYSEEEIPFQATEPVRNLKVEQKQHVSSIPTLVKEPDLQNREKHLLITETNEALIFNDAALLEGIEQRLEAMCQMLEGDLAKPRRWDPDKLTVYRVGPEFLAAIEAFVAKQRKIMAQWREAVAEYWNSKLKDPVSKLAEVDQISSILPQEISIIKSREDDLLQPFETLLTEEQAIINSSQSECRSTKSYNYKGSKNLNKIRISTRNRRHRELSQCSEPKALSDCKPAKPEGTYGLRQLTADFMAITHNPFVDITSAWLTANLPKCDLRYIRRMLQILCTLGIIHQLPELEHNHKVFRFLSAAQLGPTIDQFTFQVSADDPTDRQLLKLFIAALKHKGQVVLRDCAKAMLAKLPAPKACNEKTVRRSLSDFISVMDALGLCQKAGEGELRWMGQRQDVEGVDLEFQKIAPVETPKKQPIKQGKTLRLNKVKSSQSQGDAEKVKSEFVNLLDRANRQKKFDQLRRIREQAIKQAKKKGIRKVTQAFIEMNHQIGAVVSKEELLSPFEEEQRLAKNVLEVMQVVGFIGPARERDKFTWQGLDNIDLTISLIDGHCSPVQLKDESFRSICRQTIAAFKIQGYINTIDFSKEMTDMNQTMTLRSTTDYVWKVSAVLETLGYVRREHNGAEWLSARQTQSEVEALWEAREVEEQAAQEACLNEVKDSFCDHDAPVKKVKKVKTKTEDDEKKVIVKEEKPSIHKRIALDFISLGFEPGQTISFKELQVPLSEHDRKHIFPVLKVMALLGVVTSTTQDDQLHFIWNGIKPIEEIVRQIDGHASQDDLQKECYKTLTRQVIVSLKIAGKINLIQLASTLFEYNGKVPSIDCYRTYFREIVNILDAVGLVSKQQDGIEWLGVRQTPQEIDDLWAIREKLPEANRLLLPRVEREIMIKKEQSKGEGKPRSVLSDEKTLRLKKCQMPDRSKLRHLVRDFISLEIEMDNVVLFSELQRRLAKHDLRRIYMVRNVLKTLGFLSLEERQVYRWCGYKQMLQHISRIYQYQKSPEPQKATEAGMVRQIVALLKINGTMQHGPLASQLFELNHGLSNIRYIERFLVYAKSILRELGLVKKTEPQRIEWLGIRQTSEELDQICAEEERLKAELVQLEKAELKKDELKSDGEETDEAGRSELAEQKFLNKQEILQAVEQEVQEKSELSECKQSVTRQPNEFESQHESEHDIQPVQLKFSSQESREESTSQDQVDQMMLQVIRSLPETEPSHMHGMREILSEFIALDHPLQLYVSYEELEILLQGRFEKRRIYEVCKILSSLGLISKGTHGYTYLGFENLEQELDQIEDDEDDLIRQYIYLLQVHGELSVKQAAIDLLPPGVTNKEVTAVVRRLYEGDNILEALGLVVKCKGVSLWVGVYN